MKKTARLLALLIPLAAGAQDSAVVGQPLAIGAYAECFYLYDPDHPPERQRPLYFTNHNRHDEVGLNLAIISAKYRSASMRGNVALMAGNYSIYNLSGEPIFFRSIFEANAGLRLFRNHDTWIDAGVLPSHIGFETPKSTEVWTLTRSIVADNTPYYETGIRLSHRTRDQKLYAALLYLNGWQRIQRPSGIYRPSVGSQLTWSPDGAASFNWSTFAGEVPAGSGRQLRVYNNFYAQLYPGRKTGIIAGFDGGAQFVTPSSFVSWYAPVVIVRQALGTRWFVAGRAEYFNDRSATVLLTRNNDGVVIQGYSVNADFVPVRNAMWRIEARWLFAGGYHDAAWLRRPWNVSFATSISFSI